MKYSTHVLPRQPPSEEMDAGSLGTPTGRQQPLYVNARTHRRDENIY